jgi:plastocyanin
MNPMRAAILLLGLHGVSAGALAAEVVVSVSNFAFTPATVTVAPGDTVRWVRVSGNHTVTSGNGCVPDGRFNAPINTTTPSFTWQVPSALAGSTVRYYCAPHCSSMQGTVIVTQPPNPADLNGDGAVNGDDLGIMLGAWGTPGPGDLNADGTVNGDDLGILLGAWSA